MSRRWLALPALLVAAAAVHAEPAKSAPTETESASALKAIRPAAEPDPTVAATAAPATSSGDVVAVSAAQLDDAVAAAKASWLASSPSADFSGVTVTPSPSWIRGRPASIARTETPGF